MFNQKNNVIKDLITCNVASWQHNRVAVQHMLSFSEIIKTEIYSQEITLTSLSSNLDKKGFNISPKRLSEYQNGLITPSFEKAKAILDELGFTFSSKEIIESLELNREVCKVNKAYTADLYKLISVRVLLKKLIPNMEPEQIETILNDRIINLYGDKTKISNYIHDLISKDLNEFILERKKEDDKNHRGNQRQRWRK